jgi:hypothetical protein
MNLVAKEFVVCQRENAGVLILSEFAGAAEELFNALFVNPYDARTVAETLSSALALSMEEKRARIDPMRERVMKYDARHWARSFINDLTSLTVPDPWKKELLNILRLYEEATPGSFVEEKRSSLAWHYRKADQEFGAWKARKLTRQLVALTANKPIQVFHGKKIVEVCAAQVNKGAAVAQVLEEEGPYESVVCAGDDRSDETMFELNTPELLSVKSLQIRFCRANWM